MKYNFRHLVFYVAFHFSLLFSSCNQQSDDSHQIQKIKVFENEIENVKSSKLIDNVDYITLECDSNSVIGKINKFIISDKYIFIMDAEQVNKIFQFDASGNFIRVIGSAGRGPGEYQTLVDFNVCSTTQNVFVLDINRKLIVFNQNGDLIQELRIDQGDPLSSRILAHNSDIYLYTGRGKDYSSRYSIIELGSEGKEIDNFLKFEIAPNYSITFESPLYVWNNRLMFFDPFDGVLFEMNEEQFSPKYQLDFNNKGIPIGYLCDFDKYSKHIIDYSLTNQYFIEGDHFFYYSIVDKMNYKHGFFSKVTGKSFLIKNIINDDHIFRNPEFFYNDYFYSVIEPHWLFEKSTNFKHIIDKYSVDKFGNPIIMKYKLKEL